MAEKSGIAWTRSTFIPWIGCTKIGPGCDHCYAAEMDDKRFSRHLGGGTKEVPISHWGVGAPRYRTSMQNWNLPLKWEKKAAAGDKPWRVFCASLADVFDNEVPVEWRNDLARVIHVTPNLSWLLVTKRIGNVEKMVPGWVRDGFPPNVRLLITVCNQEEAGRDIPKLLALPCKNGVSYEPALGPINFRPWLSPRGHINWGDNKNPSIEDQRAVLAIAKAAYYEGGSRLIEWIIVGGESTQGAGKARPFDREWAYSTIRQCGAAGVPCFVKQLGSNVIARNDAHGCDVYAPRFLDRAGADPAEWPADLRVQEFP